MKCPQLSLMLMFVLLLGCSGGEAPTVKKEDPPGAQDQVAIPAETSPIARKLSNVGEPDDETRKVDGILIVGSALTDDHVAAIRRLTDSKAPRDAKKDLIRNIQHEAPNKAINIWQGTHFESYQSLVLVDGVWELEESAGGFGTFR